MIYIFIAFALFFIAIAAYSFYMKYRAKMIQKQVHSLEERGKYQEAVEEYEKALKDQDDGNLLWRLANLHEKMGKKEMAVQRLKQMVTKKKYPSGAREKEVNLKLAILLFQLKRDEESFQILIQLYRQNKKEIPVLQYMILIALGQRRCDVASILLKKLMDIEKDANSLLYLGICNFERGDYQAAIPVLKEASNKESSDWRIPFIEGICHYMKGDYHAAPLIMEKIVKKDIPINIIELAYQILVRCYLKEEGSENGLSQCERAIKIIKSKSEEFQPEKLVEDTLFISLLSNDLDRAFQYFDQQLVMAPDSQKLQAMVPIFNELFEQRNSLAKKKLDDLPFHGEPSNESQLNLPEPDENEPELMIKPEVTNEVELVESEELNIQEPFAEFLEMWEQKDIVEDTVWNIFKLSREVSFDVSRYLEGGLFTPQQPQKLAGGKIEMTPMCRRYNDLKKNDFLDSSKKILTKLNFRIIEEKYNSDEVFLSQGDGVDYLATIKGNEADRYLVQIRRWDTNSIGELVIKNLTSEMQTKRAKKAIFITTGELSKEAMDYVELAGNINVIQKKQLEHLLNDLVTVN